MIVLRIGSLQFDMPFVQAALSGYSDLPMRRLARRFGAPYTLAEPVLDRLVLERGKTRKRVLTVPDDDHPVGGQLMGAGPADFGPAAHEMAQLRRRVSAACGCRSVYRGQVRQL